MGSNRLNSKVMGIDLSQDRQALQRLKEAAEKAKIELSSVMESEDTARIIQLTEQLQQASYAIGQQLYAQQASGSDFDSGASRDAEGVVDGEFSEA